MDKPYTQCHQQCNVIVEIESNKSAYGIKHSYTKKKEKKKR